MVLYGSHTHTQKENKHCALATHVRKTQIRMHGMCEYVISSISALEEMTHAPMNHDDVCMLFQFSVW